MNVTTRFSTLLIGLICLLQAFSLNAASGNFTIEEAVQYGLENNVKVNQSRLQREIADQQIRETRAAGLPQVSGSIALENYLERPVSLIPGEFIGQPEEEFVEISFGTEYDVLASATVEQLIFDGQYIVALQASRAYRSWRDKELEQEIRDTREAIQKAYLRAVLMDEATSLLEDNIVQLRSTLEETELMYENGFVEKLDVDRIRLQLNRVSTDHENAMNDLQNALQLLKVEMGYPVTEPLETQGSLSEFYESMGNAEVRPYTDVYSDRIESDLLRSREEIAHLERRRFKAGYLPTLSGYATHRQNAQRNEFSFFETDRDWFPSTVFGVRLNIPVFDGFTKNALIQQKNIELNQLEYQRYWLEQSIIAEMEQAVNNRTSAGRRVINETENVQLAESIYEQTLERYREGIGSSRDVTDAQNDLNRAQINYLNALLDLLISEIDLKLANGTL